MSIGRLLLFALTFLAFLMGAVAVTYGPPPLWVAVAFFTAYLTLIGVGAMNLQLRMFGDAICQVRGAKDAVALTFDDGPDPVSTGHVLHALEQAGAQATFFVVGKKADKYPDVLRDIVSRGHELGVHSYGHHRLYSFLPPAVVEADIKRTQDVIEKAVGLRPLWFRPPVGQMSPRTAEGVERAKALVVGWNVRARDGLRSTSTEDCERRVLNGIEAGAIVLMHDAWERDEVDAGEGSLARCPAGVRALATILTECRRRGLKPVTVTQLLEAEGGGVD